jgi:hypothetical protein
LISRVLHYVDSDAFGGSEEAALHLMASLDRSRWDPVLLHHQEPGIARLVESAAHLGVRTIAVPPIAASSGSGARSGSSARRSSMRT